MTRKDADFAKIGVPRIIGTLMRGHIPIIGVAASWIVMLSFMLAARVFFGIKPGFEGGVKEQFTAGNLAGGLLLGMRAVLLIGCEIRSYMRIGLGYLNTWVGFMEFAVGNLPYTLFEPAHIAFQEATLFTSTHNKNMEDIQTHIDLVAARNGGRIGGVMAPIRVPLSGAEAAATRF